MKKQVDQQEVLTLLRDARERIESPDHWCKHTMQRENRYCMVGAVAKWDRDKFEATILALTRELPDHLDYSSALTKVSKVAIFNDAEATTHTDVLAVFDRAIKRLEGSHAEG